MQQIGRRRALRLTGVGIGTALAGCIGGSGPSDGGESPRNTDGTGTDGGDETPTPDYPAFETVQYALTQAAPDWYDGDQGPPGRVRLIDDEERARAVLDTGALPEERREAVEAFLGETDFGRSVVAHVQTVGPDGCHRAVDVSNLELVDGRLVGDAAAADTSDGEGVCSQALTYPSALVRATTADAPPTEATFTITGPGGDATEVTATVEDPLGPDPADLSGHVRPDSDPTVRDPLTCDRSGVERVESWVEDPPWGKTAGEDGPAFALRVDALEVSPGDAVTVTMTNVGDAVGHTGNRHKYGLQTLTGDGWQDVRVVTDGGPLAYTDEAVLHRPGEGFEWSFELTEDGLLADHVHGDRLAVCPDLEPGRYRFVFWEPAVAVAFDVVDETA